MGSSFIENLEPRRLFDAGALDTTFGTGGRTEFAPASGAGRLLPLDIDVSPAGQIVVTSASQGSDDPTAKIQLTRLRPDGSLDTNFGASGSLLLDVPTPGLGSIHTHLTPAGGEVLQVGNLLYKLTASGRWDRTFGTRGRVIMPASGTQDVEDVTVDPQGRVVTVGRSAAGNLEFRRLRTDGAADMTFGTDGVLSPPQAVADVNRCLAATLPDGSMVFAALAKGTEPAGEFTSPAFDIVATKLRPDGTVDTGYGGLGLTRQQFQNTDLDTLDVSGMSISPYDGSVFTGVVVREELTSVKSELHVLGPSGQLASAANVQVFGPSAYQFNDMLRDGALWLKLSSSDVSFLDVAAGRIVAPSTAATTNLNVSDFEPTRMALEPDGSILVLGVQNSAAGNNIELTRLFRDDAPVGLPTARTLAAPRTGSYHFTVTWRDGDGVDVSFLGDDDVTVKFPDGTRRRARLVGTDVPSGNVVTATYLVTSADGGWSHADNGRYTIRVERRSVRDKIGNVAQQRVIGEFFVQIPVVIEGAPVAAAAAAVTARRAVDDLFGNA